MVDPESSANNNPPESTTELSIIVPVFNEQDNLLTLHEKLGSILQKIKMTCEIIYVDDGSTDSSADKLARIAQSDPHVKVIFFRRNFGQTAAMCAGIDHSKGKILIFIDADLQNDPEDIPKLLAKLDEGYDIVSGWRKDRKDSWLHRRLPSNVANWLISKVTGVKLKDYGCTLKAYRKEVLTNMKLYGEMHRFMPALASQVGASLVEIPVNHYPRERGKSNYGLERIYRVVLDLFTVKFMGSFSGSPMYLFGGIGLLLISLSLVSGVSMLIQKITQGISFIQTPLLLLSTLLLLLGFNSLLLGLLAEVLVRTYHESQQKATYVVREIIEGQG
jgi:glycosyltransferase involved in cell wall biosynthesis